MMIMTMMSKNECVGQTPFLYSILDGDSILTQTDCNPNYEYYTIIIIKEEALIV